MMTNTGLFDMDGSLAGYSEQLLADLRLLRAPEEPELGDDLWAAEERLPHIKARMKLIKAIPGWWRNLPPIPNGMRVFHESRRVGFINHVLTKGPHKHSLAWAEKHEWCHHHLGDDTPVTVTEDKSLVYGKFLYDDFPDYATYWLEHRPNGLVIMPATLWNKDYTHPQCLKWDGTNWDQVVHALETVFKRKHGEPLNLKF
jgi:5'-nucleotidase